MVDGLRNPGIELDLIRQVESLVSKAVNWSWRITYTFLSLDFSGHISRNSIRRGRSFRGDLARVAGKRAEAV